MPKVVERDSVIKGSFCDAGHHNNGRSSRLAGRMRSLSWMVLMCAGVALSVDALTCRTDGGPKEEQLKQIYMNCLRSQSDKNSSNSREYSSNNRREHRERDHSDNSSSKERRKLNPQWDRKSDGFGSRDDWSGGTSEWPSRSRDRNSGTSGSRDDWGSGSNGRDGYSGAGRYGRPTDGGQDRRSSSRDRGTNGRDDYMESPDYGGDMPRFNNNFRSSSQPSHRMKRERSSGHRSQYNPNTSPKISNNGYRNNERNSSENTTQDDSMQACALHCFLEELDMTGENGMPDRYLVTQMLTKDVKNEDLRDFLQESTDECFRILYNEKSQDKCDFSKNLMMCLSEKGRANCDDWKDDLKL